MGGAETLGHVVEKTLRLAGDAAVAIARRDLVEGAAGDLLADRQAPAQRRFRWSTP